MNSGSGINGTVSQSQAKENAQTLLLKYYQQLLFGCGNPQCCNAYCASSGKLPVLSPNDAAAKALKLLSSNAAVCVKNSEQICSAVSNMEVDSCETDSGNKVALVRNADAGGSFASSYCRPLSESRLLEMVADRSASGDDFSSIRLWVLAVFQDPVMLNFSFSMTTAPGGSDRKERVTIDADQARRSLRMVFDTAFPEATLPALFEILCSTLKSCTTDPKRLEESFEHHIHRLNIYVLIMELPVLNEPLFMQKVFPEYCVAISQLPVQAHGALARFWSRSGADRLLDMVRTVQQLVTITVLTNASSKSAVLQENQCITAAVQLLHIFYYASLLGGDRDSTEFVMSEKLFYMMRDAEMPVPLVGNQVRMKEDENHLEDQLGKELNIRHLDVRRPLIDYSEFYNETLSDAVEMDRDFLNHKAGDGRFSFMHYPFILTPATKVEGMDYDNRIRMSSERRFALVQTLLLGTLSQPFLKLHIRRSNIVEDTLSTLEVIAMENPGDLKKQLFIEFDGEQGVDEGGVSKEFYQLLTEQLFNPDYGMFVYNNETNTFWFNPQCTMNFPEYTLIGMLFGLAIYNSVIIDVKFPMVLYCKLLGKLGVFSDLQGLDPTLYHSLKSMLEYDGDDFEDVFAYTFQISYEDVYGTTVTHELVDGGKDMLVTKSNREKFVYLYADFLLNLSVADQFQAFRHGFRMVTNESPLAWLFRPDEIEQLVCGAKQLDFSQLEKIAVYDNGFNSSHPTIRYFWETVEEMEDQQKRLLLQFATGSDRLPVGGLSKMRLIIARNGSDSERLPTAHTCFNVLLLPEYSTKEKMKDRLLKAINYSKGFGLL